MFGGVEQSCTQFVQHVVVTQAIGYISRWDPQESFRVLFQSGRGPTMDLFWVQSTVYAVTASQGQRDEFKPWSVVTWLYLFEVLQNSDHRIRCFCQRKILACGYQYR